MASISLSLPAPAAASKSPSCAAESPANRRRNILFQSLSLWRPERERRTSHVVRMAPEEEKITRRSPLDFPIEWERPKPGRRPDIFPQFSPMKTPLPPPLPADPPEEDEEDEEQKKEEEEEGEDPDRENPDKPQSSYNSDVFL